MIAEGAGRLACSCKSDWCGLASLASQLAKLEKKDIGAINHGLERLRLQTRKLQLEGELDATAQADLDAERAAYEARYKVLEGELVSLHARVRPRQLGAA